jgi:hypothetical protein
VGEAGGVAQDIGPEFKPQSYKKKKNPQTEDSPCCYKGHPQPPEASEHTLLSCKWKLCGLSFKKHQSMKEHMCLKQVNKTIISGLVSSCLKTAGWKYPGGLSGELLPQGKTNSKPGILGLF